MRSTQKTAASPRAVDSPEFALLEAREILDFAIKTAPGNFPVQRQILSALVLAHCAEPVAQAIIDAGGGGQQRGAQEVVVNLIAFVGSFANPWLALRCMSIAFGMPSGNEDETTLAAEFGVTKACVSNICVGICDKFGIPPGRGMKRPAAREAYARRQTGRRARPPALPWAFSGLFLSLRGAA